MHAGVARCALSHAIPSLSLSCSTDDRVRVFAAAYGLSSWGRTDDAQLKQRLASRVRVIKTFMKRRSLLREIPNSASPWAFEDTQKPRDPGSRSPGCLFRRREGIHQWGHDLQRNHQSEEEVIRYLRARSRVSAIIVMSAVALDNLKSRPRVCVHRSPCFESTLSGHDHGMPMMANSTRFWSRR